RPPEEHGLDPVDVLNSKLDQMEEAGMERTKEWASVWQENLRYFFGDQLHDKKSEKEWEWIIVNYLWASAMQEIAKLSRNNPKIMTPAWEQGDTDAAEVWQSHLQWHWQKGLNNTGMRIEQLRAILDGKLFGYRVSKVFWEEKDAWDDRQTKWTGNVKYKLWHPAQFWADADEKINDGNCGTFRYVSLEWAKSRWPEFKKELDEEADKYEEPTSGWMGTHIRGAKAAPSTTSQTGSTDPGDGAGRADAILNLVMRSDKTTGKMEPKEKEKVIKLSEIYFKDYEEVERIQEENIPADELIKTGLIYEQGAIFYDSKTNTPFDDPKKWPKREARRWKEPKYPYGRYVIRAGKTILNPGEESGKSYGSQRFPYKKWPFVTVPHYLLPHMWQGSDAIQLYKSAQDLINVSVSHLLNNMKNYGDPKIAMETGAVETNPRTGKHFKIGKGAGAIIRLVRGAWKDKRFGILDPPTPSVAAMQFYGLMSQEFKNIVGLQSIGKGEKQPGELTATEAQWLAISSNDRIQLQSVFEDEWIKGVCERVAEICQVNYDEGRYIRIVGEDKTAGIQKITQQLKSIQFDVEILPATTLPYDPDKRIDKHLKAYEILSQPVINPMLPEILRDLEVTNWKKLLQQHEPWMMWIQFLQLVEAVKAKKVDVNEALRVIANRLYQLQQMQQLMTPAPKEDGPERETKTKTSEEKITGGEKAGTKKTREVEETIRS
ncbi:MAG: portal protein, partial [Planctomycetota bacterium]